jgi:hypothetical protein
VRIGAIVLNRRDRPFRPRAGFLSVVIAVGVCVIACGGGSDAKKPSNVTAEVADKVATVVKVGWTTATPSTGYVEYGPTAALGLRTPAETTATTSHAAILLGLTANTVYHYRAVTMDGSAPVAGDAVTIRTGNLPLGLPILTTTGTGQSGFIVVPVVGMAVAVVILNGNGDIVWYHKDDRKLDFYRARLARDGKSVLYNAAKISGDPSPDSAIVRVALDGTEVSSVPIPFLAHDFVEHPDGTLGALAIEYRDFQGTAIAGNKIVEVAPDGTQRTVWTSWDCFDPAAITGDDLQQGWTFANALDYDAAANVYYVGMRNFSSIARINRQTRACEWVLGLGAPTLTFAPGAPRFLHQHQFQVRGNHVLVMDNDGAPGNASRILEYELDLVARTATSVGSYTSNPSVYTFVFGEPLRFDDGTTFINWGAAGQMERLDPSGMSTWKLNTNVGYAFGFHTLVDSLYTGAALPAGLSGT